MMSFKGLDRVTQLRSDGSKGLRLTTQSKLGSRWGGQVESIQIVPEPPKEHWVARDPLPWHLQPGVTALPCPPQGVWPCCSGL